MPWQSNSVIVGLLAGAIVGGAVLAGVAAFFIGRAMGLDGAWSQWVMPLTSALMAIALIASRMAGRKRKQQ